MLHRNACCTRVRVCFVAALTIAAFPSCHGGSSSAPPVNGAELTVLTQPAWVGSPVRLLPRFGSGAGRIEPGVGAVVNGQVVELPPFDGTRRFTLTVTIDGTTRTSEVTITPRYRERATSATSSGEARARHGSARLTDGRILLVGGSSSGPLFWASTEVFDPATGAFEPAGDLSVGRAGSTVVALPDGGALTFGGPINQSSFEAATRVEQWSPATRVWSIVGNMLCNRLHHTATDLGDGRVLLAGGAAFGGAMDERRAEIWERGIGARVPAGQAAFQRTAHTATRLPDGRVLLAGGYDARTGEPIATAELFDPASEQFVPVAAPFEARSYHAAVRTADGAVLLVGGERPDGTLHAVAARFDPQAATFAPAGTMVAPTLGSRAELLADGDVLVIGGVGEGGGTSGLLERWSATAASFRTVGSLPRALTGHALHRLPDGRVAVFGGDEGGGWPVRFFAWFD